MSSSNKKLSGNMDATETVIITDPANVNENAICEGPIFVVPRFLVDDDGRSKQKTKAAPIQVDNPAMIDNDNGVLQFADEFIESSW
jgi:hypothetical protein